MERKSVESMIFVPKYFFVPDLVERRKPLAESAHRAGWVGCNILFEKIPAQGRIPIIENRIALEKDGVLNRVKQAQKFQTNDISARGWLLE